MKGANLFQRLLLPGLAFKAVVIGGGYATGRELAAFFMPAGPRGGLCGMLLAMTIWSVVCAVTFLFALRTHSADYRTFFRHLLGPLWPAFEVSYLLALIVVLSALAAAAGSIGSALFGWPPLLGSISLVACITLVVTHGNDAVEQLFKYVSFFLYAIFALFMILALSRFGSEVILNLETHTETAGWLAGGATYAGYNIIGAIIILPTLRHITAPRDALIAGLCAGPLAMAPALLLFVCMLGFYPTINDQLLPTDYMLERLDIPGLRVTFQLMVFTALLESGTGCVHAINQRVAKAYSDRHGKDLSKVRRAAVSTVVLAGSIFVATKYGLVAIIAGGYRWLAYCFLAIYVAPLMTFGMSRVIRTR